MKAMRRWRMWAQMVRGTGRWGAVALAIFYFNFVSVHLATAMHFHGNEHSHSHSHSHSHAHTDAGHEDEHEHDDEDDSGTGHAPHDASEHLLDVALKGVDPAVAGPALAITSQIFVLDTPVFFTRSQLVFERERPPGVLPPDPLQPRAPPIA